MKEVTYVANVQVTVIEKYSDSCEFFTHPEVIEEVLKDFIGADDAKVISEKLFVRDEVSE